MMVIVSTNADIALRKHDGKWYEFDDAKVTPITAEEVVVSY